MSVESKPIPGGNPEQSKPIDVVNAITEIHEQFLARVPRYDRRVWNPEDALRTGIGGCMAELLFVAGGLVGREVIDQDNIFIRFRNDHGTVREAGIMQTRQPDIKHAVMMLKIQDIWFEGDFRAHRAAEDPQFQTVLDAEVILANTDLTIAPLVDGMHKYAHALGVEDEKIPTIDDLVEMQDPNYQPKSVEEDINFDETF